MKGEVKELVRIMAAGGVAALPAAVRQKRGRRDAALGFVPSPELEAALVANEEAEFARFLLELHDENESQAEYTLAVLSYLEQRRVNAE